MFWLSFALGILQFVPHATNGTGSRLWAMIRVSTTAGRRAVVKNGRFVPYADPSSQRRLGFAEGIREQMTKTKTLRRGHGRSSGRAVLDTWRLNWVMDRSSRGWLVEYGGKCDHETGDKYVCGAPGGNLQQTSRISRAFWLTRCLVCYNQGSWPDWIWR